MVVQKIRSHKHATPERGEYPQHVYVGLSDDDRLLIIKHDEFDAEYDRTDIGRASIENIQQMIEALEALKKHIKSK